MQIDDTGIVKYKREEKMNMKITDCIISPETLGNKLLLIDVRPAHQYMNGKPTDEICAYRYDIVLPEKQMEKISVKIKGKQLMEKPTEPIEVQFEKLRTFIYWMNGEYHIGAKASGIHPVNKG